jgi:hypothetical protein
MVRIVFPLYLCGIASNANMPTLIGSEGLATSAQLSLCMPDRRHPSNTVMVQLSPFP